MARTPSEFAAARAELLAEAPRGAPLRDALTALADEWLSELVGDTTGVSLLAVGAYGRRDPAPGSDLDLVLVHQGRSDIAALAEKLWYPIWDSGVKLDHSMRTVDEAVGVASGDLKAALGLLDARHVAGDPALTGVLRTRIHEGWRSQAHKRLPELIAATAAREERFGELAYLLEGDIKEARGGLRDVHAIRAAAAAWVVDAPSERVQEAYAVLLDIRGELHRTVRRPTDRLMFQDQDLVAERCGYGDADELLAAVAGAARTIAYSWSLTARQVSRWVGSRKRFRGRPAPRRPIADGVVEQDGEVHLSADADTANDAVLVLRAAAAAAQHNLPFAPHTLERLAASPALPEPWSDDARDSFVALLGAGAPLIDVIESLDQVGIMTRLLPEWQHVRSLPQRNALHRFTVDRHLVETTVQAAEVARRVDRPDLLLVAAFLHDIGKGFEGDHSIVGAQMMDVIAPRMGFSPADSATLRTLVLEHLLLPIVATRRDLDDPLTISRVAERITDRGTVELLRALSVADGTATGAAAWNEWKAGMVGDLARRVSAVLSGAPLPLPDPIEPHLRTLADRGEFALDVQPGVGGFRVTAIARDRPGLLATYAGALAVHRLDVRGASASSVGDMAVTTFVVATKYGDPPSWAALRDAIRSALDDSAGLEKRLAEQEKTYATVDKVVAPPWVSLRNDLSESATVIEVRAHDSVGLLYRLARVVADHGLDVRSAKVASLGAEVVDAFYVVDTAAARVTDATKLAELESALIAAVA
ncbi:MAG: [protein-PII] uridylyltransferase [Frankiaceae bacterium]|nr:[protein-PII] uridylyltransferase [Frankiaceae bacterium]